MRLRVLVGAVAVAALGGCQTGEPITFQFKWFENDPAYSWFAECHGEPPRDGAKYSGRIEIVDKKLARRLARMESWDKLTAEDLKGMRCVPPEEEP